MTDRSPIRSSTQSPARSPQRSPLRSPSRVLEALEKPIHYESPSKYDIDFYQRKVNRLENELNTRQDELNLMRFRLQKADDFEIKYELLIKENQELVLEVEKLLGDLATRTRDFQEARARLSEYELNLNSKNNQLSSFKRQLENTRMKHDQNHQKSSQNNQSDRAQAEQQFNKKLQQLRSLNKGTEEKLNQHISDLRDEIGQKNINQESNSSRLLKMRNDKDQEIARLRTQVKSLQVQLIKLRGECNDKVSEVRKDNYQKGEQRNQQLVAITETSKTLLAQEIEHLNQAIRTKNQQVSQLLQGEKTIVMQHQQMVDELQGQIKKLQDKIFEIHRLHEMELFNAIEKLQKEHANDLATANLQFRRVENQYEDRVKQLNNQVRIHKEDKDTLTSSLRNAEETVHKVSGDRERMVSNLSHKIIQMQAMKDEQVRNLTTSMRVIQEEAEIKLSDLHNAILNKNSQFQIMTKQIELKNTEISHLLDEINKLRVQNRQRLEKMDGVYSKEQTMLNQVLNQMKRINHELKRQLFDVSSELEDKEKQFTLEKDLNRDELNQQKEINQRLNSRNDMLRVYIKQLEDDLKQERTQNVDVIQDTNVTRRQVLQEREKVKGELQVIKNKEIDQMRNIFNIDLNKLKNENNNLLHKLRDKVDQYQKLLKDFKDLEDKHSGDINQKISRAEDIAKRQATLQCEINLTRNIISAISKNRSDIQ